MLPPPEALPRSTGASFFSDRPNAARELALSSVARMQLLCLQDSGVSGVDSGDRPSPTRSLERGS